MWCGRRSAGSAQLEERQEDVVVSGVECEAELDDAARILEIVPSLLDGDDVRDLRQLGKRLDTDQVHDAGRDVVVDDRLVRHGRDRLDVLDDPAGRWLVVVRVTTRKPSTPSSCAFFVRWMEWRVS